MTSLICNTANNKIKPWLRSVSIKHLQRFNQIGVDGYVALHIGHLHRQT